MRIEQHAGTRPDQIGSARQKAAAGAAVALQRGDVIWSALVMIASARSSMALMFAHDSSAGDSAASMLARWIPFDQ
jgi:hypothetical protein